MAGNLEDTLKSAQELIDRLKPSTGSNTPTTPVEESEDELDSIFDWGFGGSSGDSGSDRALESKYEANVTLLPQTTPVENSFHIDFGFDSVDQNVEIDEDGEAFVTYHKNRTFEPDVISFIERTFHDTGNIPTFKELHEVFKDYPEAPRYLKGWKEVIEGFYNRDLLTHRGLPTYRTVDAYLEPAFITACHRILNFRDKRSDTAKLKEIGVTTARWNNWLKRKTYFDYYKVHADKIFDEELLVETKRGLATLVGNADLSAIKYVDERTGVYRSNNGNNTEVIAVVIQAIMSILARTVEASVINQISMEIRSEPAIKELLSGSIEAKAS